MKKTIFKSLLMGLAALTALTASAENRIYIEDFEIAPGETKTIEVLMDNDIPVMQLQVFLTFSEGLTHKKLSSSKLMTDRFYYIPSELPEDNPAYDPDEDEPTTVGGIAPSFNSIGGQERYVFVSMNQIPFAGNSGPVFRFQVTASEDFTGGYILIDNYLAQNQEDALRFQGGTERGGEEIRTIVTAPVAGTPLADVVANGVDGTEYTIAENLHVVTASPKAGCVFVSDGNGNWMKIAAEGEVYTALAGIEDIKAGTLKGVLSDAGKNQTLTVTEVPQEGTVPVNVDIQEWNLAQSDTNSPTYKFAPKTNEVIALTGYYFDDEKAFRGYSSGVRGQSATADMSWCNSDKSLVNGTYYKGLICVAQLKEAWEAETENAPAKVKASDELSFQNYIVYPIAIEDSNILTGVESLNGSKEVVGVQYVNVAGQVSSTPFNGVNMVITRYADGSQVASKVIK